MKPNKKENAEKPTVKPLSNVPYLVAVVIMLFIAVTGVVLIAVLVPDAEIALVIAAVFGFLSPTTLSLLAFMKSQETHLAVNSRLDEFIRNAKLAAQAEGEVIGRDLADARTDALAKSSAPPVTLNTE